MSKKQNPKPAVAKLAKVATQSAEHKMHLDLNELRDRLDHHVSKQAQEYLDFVADPFHNKATRPILYSGQYVGSTGLVFLDATTTVTIGTSGVGFVTGNLCRGPTNKSADAPLWTTGATYAGTSALAIDTTAVGVSGTPWNRAPYDSTQSVFTVVWRPIAGAIMIVPRGSATNQDGIFSLLEVPGHTTQYSSNSSDFSIGDVVNHPRARIVRGAQLGDQSVLNVLNWHPQSSAFSATTNFGNQTAIVDDLRFRPFNPSNTTGQVGSLCIAIEGTAGNTYEVRMVGAFETKGNGAFSVKPSYQDPLASAYILNFFAHKRMSGWVGRPREVEHAYKAGLHHVIRKNLPKAKKWIETGKDVMSLVREIGGFIF